MDWRTALTWDKRIRRLGVLAVVDTNVRRVNGSYQVTVIDVHHQHYVLTTASECAAFHADRKEGVRH